MASGYSRVAWTMVARGNKTPGSHPGGVAIAHGLSPVMSDNEAAAYRSVLTGQAARMNDATAAVAGAQCSVFCEAELIEAAAP